MNVGTSVHAADVFGIGSESTVRMCCVMLCHVVSCCVRFCVVICTMCCEYVQAAARKKESVARSEVNDVEANPSPPPGPPEDKHLCFGRALQASRTEVDASERNDYSEVSPPIMRPLLGPSVL